jgi:hypothetical protein
MLYYDEDIIKIDFKKKFFKDLKQLYFIPNKQTIYYDNSHLNYIYEENINNIQYIFHGFFKDDYFVIIIDSYNNEIDVNIEHKEVILIKLNWTVDMSYNEKKLLILDKLFIKKLNTIALILPIRNKLFINNNIIIDDYIKLYEYNKIKIKISLVNKIKKPFLYLWKKMLFF